MLLQNLLTLLFLSGSCSATILPPRELLDDRVSLNQRATSSGTCTTTLRSPPPPAFHCVEQGTLKQPALPLRPTSTTSENACRDACLSMTKCVSFTFNRSSRACTLYPQTLQSQGFTASSTSKIYMSNRRCFKMTCPKCPSGQAICSNGGACQDILSDSNNCGACGNVCPDHSSCRSGSCLCYFTGEPPCADGTCDFVSANNCGQCEHACPTPNTCVEGESLGRFETGPARCTTPSYTLTATSLNTDINGEQPGTSSHHFWSLNYQYQSAHSVTSDIYTNNLYVILTEYNNQIEIVTADVDDFGTGIGKIANNGAAVGNAPVCNIDKLTLQLTCSLTVDGVEYNVLATMSEGDRGDGSDYYSVYLNNGEQIGYTPLILTADHYPF